MSPRPPPVPFAQLPPGYPKLSELVCKDKTLSIFRKFRSLSIRNLLYLQSEILDLESQLQQEDKKLSLTTPEDLKSWQAFSGSFERTQLVSTIRHKLNDYCKTYVENTIFGIYRESDQTQPSFNMRKCSTSVARRMSVLACLKTGWIASSQLLIVPKTT
jgi:hypothetical protein